MHNYHTDLIFCIDLALAAVIIALTLETIISAVIRERRFKGRSEKLFNIKQNVYELAVSGKKVSGKVCLPEISELTPQQFIDVETNRNREAVFFNEEEQKILRACFSAPEKIALIEKIALNPWNKWRRIEAILSLGHAHADTSLEVLKKTVNSRDNDVAYFSVISLGQIHNLESAKVLLKFLKTRRLFQHSIFSVLEVFPVSIADKVIELTQDKNAQVRTWALELLSRLKPKHYQKQVEKLISDRSEEVRAAACDCLGQIGSEESGALIVKCLHDDFWLVRVHAVNALSKILGKNCLQEIISCINDPSLSVIDSIKGVLVEHVESAIPYLDGFLNGKDEVAKRVSIEVLEISGYTKKLLENLSSDNQEIKNRAKRLLEGLILSHAHFGIEGALGGFNPEKREEIIQVIRGIDAAAAKHIEDNIAKNLDELT
jgi:HEAT repeat protein